MARLRFSLTGLKSKTLLTQTISCSLKCEMLRQMTMWNVPELRWGKMRNEDENSSIIRMFNDQRSSKIYVAFIWRGLPFHKVFYILLYLFVNFEWFTSQTRRRTWHPRSCSCANSWKFIDEILPCLLLITYFFILRHDKLLISNCSNLQKCSLIKPNESFFLPSCP